MGEDRDDNVRESNEGITHMKIVFGIAQADQRTFPFMDSSEWSLVSNEVVLTGIYGFCHQSLKPS